MFLATYPLVLLFSIFWLVKVGHAFCIYNTFTDGTGLFVYQYDNFGNGVLDNDTKFKAEIAAGEKACCNWKESTCNRNGAQDALTRFVIWTEFSTRGRVGLSILHICAGGYANVGGDKLRPTIQSYYPDGRPYTYTGSPETADVSGYY